jgi:hypothetical protein
MVFCSTVDDVLFKIADRADAASGHSQRHFIQTRELYVCPNTQAPTGPI